MHYIETEIQNRIDARNRVAEDIRELRNFFRGVELKPGAPSVNELVRQTVAHKYATIQPTPTPANLVKELERREEWLATATMPEGLYCGEDDGWLDGYHAVEEFAAKLRTYLTAKGHLSVPQS